MAAIGPELPTERQTPKNYLRTWDVDIVLTVSPTFPFFLVRSCARERMRCQGETLGYESPALTAELQAQLFTQTEIATAAYRGKRSELILEWGCWVYRLVGCIWPCASFDLQFGREFPVLIASAGLDRRR